MANVLGAPCVLVKLPGVSDLASLCFMCLSSIYYETLGNYNAFPELWGRTRYVLGPNTPWDGLVEEWPAMVRGLCTPASSSSWIVKFLRLRAQSTPMLGGSWTLTPGSIQKPLEAQSTSKICAYLLCQSLVLCAWELEWGYLRAG